GHHVAGLDRVGAGNEVGFGLGGGLNDGDGLFNRVLAAAAGADELDFKAALAGQLIGLQVYGIAGRAWNFYAVNIPGMHFGLALLGIVIEDIYRSVNDRVGTGEVHVRLAFAELRLAGSGSGEERAARLAVNIGRYAGIVGA